MTYLVALYLTDSHHPKTWEVIDKAMNEIGFLAPDPGIPELRSNLHSVYAGNTAVTLEKMPDYIQAQLSKHNLPQLATKVSPLKVSVE